MNEWYNSCEKLPEQGKKILCMSDGDYYVAQRFGLYWYPIPFSDSALAFIYPPKKWQEIDFIPPNKGYIMIKCDEYEGLLTVDELEIICHELYEDLINTLLKNYEESRKR